VFMRFGRRAVARLAVLCAMAFALVLPATAHPHIFIDAKVTVVFNDAGEIVGLKHNWTFDEAFSSWVVQGLDTNGDRETSPEELQPLADDNLVGLTQYDFYTYAGPHDNPLKFTSDGDQRFVYENGRTTLTYGLTATNPQPMTNRFELGVYDPDYYVAITFADASDVVLQNAPAGCGVTLEPPKEMDKALQDRLFSLGPDVMELPPDLAAAMRGTQGMIVITCTGVAAPAPVSALDAVNQVAQAQPQVHSPSLPFGGPPKEPGLNLPHNAFTVWLQTQQREFYQAMNQALAALKTDWTAFWLLGGLSFLYGIIHAAGPGHGKVVISSYMLANETQVRRGIRLSVISAMIQSAVAVAFVLVAASILGLTSMAMDVAANWIGIISYSMVALLGLWLIVRKVFNLGHRHAHAPNNMAAKARSHLRDDHEHHGAHDHHDHEHHHHETHAEAHEHHDHMHIVPPSAATGSWREQVGVVLAVGLRPCSGALVVLAFALSQNLLAAGILAVFLMGAGTALTVAVLATIAVTAKGLAQRIGGVDNPVMGALVWWAELLGAVGVMAFGLLLVIASL
jgi:nickel/cobalt exporter